MKVRLTQQLQGARDGRDWPEPGTEVDLPDDEARALITGGSAVDPSEQRATVLVPPLGVHTPGRTAMPVDATAPLVEAPIDALADPAGARKAAEDARDGNFTEGPPGVAHQQRSGLAHTQEGLDKAGQDEQRTRESLAVASPRVGEEQTRSVKAGSDKSSDAKATADKK